MCTLTFTYFTFGNTLKYYVTVLLLYVPKYIGEYCHSFII